MAPPPVRILALTGSLRRLSANTALLRACAASPHATVVLGDVALPLYNSDTEAAEFSAPAASSPVRALRDLARGCDALLLAAPEYNHSFSPVLGNALAWLSRDGADGAVPIARKPYAAISAAGYSGGMRAQGHLRDTMHYFRCPSLLDPEFLLNLHDRHVPAGRFDPATGDVLDAALKAKLAAVVHALAALTRRLSGEAGGGGGGGGGAGLAPTTLA